MTHQDDTSDTGLETKSPNALQFDPAQYRAEVDLFDITDEQKNELLLTLWSIMRSFVELGFDGDVCAVLLNQPTTIPTDDDEVECPLHPTTEFL